MILVKNPFFVKTFVERWEQAGVNSKNFEEFRKDFYVITRLYLPGTFQRWYNCYRRYSNTTRFLKYKKYVITYEWKDYYMFLYERERHFIQVEMDEEKDEQETEEERQIKIEQDWD